VVTTTQHHAAAILVPSVTRYNSLSVVDWTSVIPATVMMTWTRSVNAIFD
jgi:hypothetical protein